jgi:cytochrome subunit of sulfide dehydrogenase
MKFVREEKKGIQNMVMKTITRVLLVAGLAFGVSSIANAKDAPKTLMGASGEALSNTCSGCHGTDGASGGPGTPSISGLSVAYFEELMKGFKTGDIPSTIMGRISKGYTEGEAKKMATFFGAKPFVPAKQAFDKAKAAKGAKLHEKNCEKCHAEGGTDVQDDTGRLAGQWTHYLKSTMADYIAGKREMTKKMKKRVMKLHTKGGDAAFDNLMAYYASQQ